MKVLFACGGTAGHINPGLAIAAAIRRRHPGAVIRFAGNPDGMEARLVPGAGFEFVPFKAMGIQRRLTTKLLAKRVDKVLLAVAKAEEYLPQEAKGKCVVTGNPVRPEILTARREEARRLCKVPEGKVCLLSFGGSLGAQRVNEAVADVMAWHKGTGNIHHIHATGQYGTELLPRLLREKGVSWEGCPGLDIREYIDDMPNCLAAADLVICRAGASTLSELEAAGRASILIPSPNVAENHQYHNAMVLQNAGAAVVLEEKDLTGETLVKLVQELTADPARLAQLGEKAKGIAALNAVETIADQVLGLVKK